MFKSDYFYWALVICCGMKIAFGLRPKPEIHIQGNTLQHECSAYEPVSIITEVLVVRPETTIVVIKSPKNCRLAELPSKKFKFIFSNEVSDNCSITTYCKDMFGEYCEKYFIRIGVGPVEVGHLDTPHLNHGTEDICELDTTFIRHLRRMEEMVIEVSYPNGVPSAGDVYSCGLYYHCEVNQTFEAPDQTSPSIGYKNQYPGPFHPIKTRPSVHPYLITTTATLTVTTTKQNIHLPNIGNEYLNNNNYGSNNFDINNNYEHTDNHNHNHFDQNNYNQQNNEDNDGYGGSYEPVNGPDYRPAYQPPTSWKPFYELTSKFPVGWDPAHENYKPEHVTSRPTLPLQDSERFSLQCSTATGRGCVSGVWTWSEGPGIAAHYVNCVPMTPEGRNIFDLSNSPGAVVGKDFDYFCPTTLDFDRQINRNKLNFFQNLDRCLIKNVRCQTNRTLEQEFAVSTRAICTTVTGKTCVPDIWRDERGRWYRGCRQVGQVKPRFECATRSDNLGRYISIEDCSTVNSPQCFQGIPQLKRVNGQPEWILN